MTDADNREVLEYDGSSGAILRWHAYGAGPNAVLGTMDLSAGTRTALVPDILGAVIGAMNAGTGALTPVSYLPYGGSSTALAALPAFAFTGQRVDRESGLYYYRARYYHTTWGRFLQPDSIGYAGSINLYTYVGNDPVNATDPSGLCVDSCVAEGISAAAAYALLSALVAAGVCVQVCQPILDSIRSAAGSILNQASPSFIKPPANAWDPNGPKSPGYPGGMPGYEDPKGGPNWVPNPNGPGYGWESKNGNVWVPTGPGGTAHGGPHWDVQQPNGDYENVYPPKPSASDFSPISYSTPGTTGAISPSQRDNSGGTPIQSGPAGATSK